MENTPDHGEGPRRAGDTECWVSPPLPPSPLRNQCFLFVFRGRASFDQTRGNGKLHWPIALSALVIKGSQPFKLDTLKGGRLVGIRRSVCFPVVGEDLLLW